jgi:hypothetical protein
MRLALVVLPACLVLLAAPAHAQDEPTQDPLALQVHGFVSQGYMVSTPDIDYLTESHRGSFEFAEVGLNVTKPLSDRLRVGIQLFARDLGPLGDYTPKVDWFHVDYRWQDWLGFRVGRTKLPFGLYNDSSDVDAARVPVLLPQSVYPTENRDFLLAQTGVEVYGHVPLGMLAALDYNLYGGTIYLDIQFPPPPNSPVQPGDISIPYIIGGRAILTTPWPGLRLAGSVQALRLDGTVYSTGPDRMTADVSIPGVLWIASLEWEHEDLLIAAEYSRWHVRVDSDNAMLLPPRPTVVSERTYLMASYRLSELVQLGSYVSLLTPDVDRRSSDGPGDGRELHQLDVALTLRLDLDEHWLLKLEGHYMNGTAGVRTDFNDDEPLSELPASWGLALVKMTASF